MPFTNKTLLQARVASDVLSVLLEGDSSLDEALAEADELVTSYTGIAPSSDNPKILSGIAGDIVIWILSGRQTQIDEHELERRRGKYDAAIRLLEEIRDGKLRITRANDADKTVPTVGCAPSRMERY